ncbi:MAG: metal-dependent hydrolase [Flavobacteriales bacterium]
MDILTHAVFGASTYAAAKGNEANRKDLFWGMSLGMLVDADVFMGFGMDSVQALLNHRSWTHSFLFTCFAALIIGLIQKRWRQETMSLRDGLAIFLAIHTHIWIDALTTYGTRIGFPFSSHPIAWNVIHVFHPMATMTLLVPWLWGAWKRRGNWGRVGAASLCAFGLFLAWPLASKSLARKGMNIDQLPQTFTIEVVPTAFNSWIWHGVANAGDSLGFATYHVGKDENPEWHWVPSNRAALAQISELQHVQQYLTYAGPDALVERDDAQGETRIYAAKFGPINYIGPPQFVHPFVLKDGATRGQILETPAYSGPWSNFNALWGRLW